MFTRPDHFLTMKALLILFVLSLLPSTSFAQDQKRRFVPPPGSQSRPTEQNSTPPPLAQRNHVPVQRNRVAVPENQAPGLTENLTLHFKGDFQGLVGLDLELTGLGPLFSAEIAIPSEKETTPATLMSLSATVSSLAPDGYKVDYSIGARIPMITSRFSSQPGGPTSVNIEYRDVLLRGVVKVKEGKALTISKINGKELKVILSQPME
jgi:hypothetical protein